MTFEERGMIGRGCGPIDNCWIGALPIYRKLHNTLSASYPFITTVIS